MTIDRVAVIAFVLGALALLLSISVAAGGAAPREATILALLAAIGVGVYVWRRSERP